MQTLTHIRSLLLVLVATAMMIGCKQALDPDPSEQTGGSDTTEITLVEQTNLPKTGGSISAFALSTDGRIVAIVDGRLFTVDESSATLTQIGEDSGYLTIAFSAGGALYATRYGALRKYDLSTESSTTITLPISQPNWSNMQVFGAPNGYVFVVTTDGFNRTTLYRSTDDGGSWSRMSVPDLFNKCYLTSTPSGDLLAASSKGVWRSSDDTKSWTQLTTATLNYGDVRVFATSAGDVFYWAPKISQMKISRNGGAFNSFTLPSSLPPPLEMAEGPNGTLYMTGVDVQFGSPIVASGVMRSSDAGATWSIIEHGIVRQLVASGSTILAGTTDDGGILASRDGAIWRTIGRSTITDVTDFGFDKDGDLLLSGGGALYRQLPSGWATLAQFGEATRFAANAKGGIVCAGVSTGLWRTIDNGTTWSANTLPPLATSQWATSVIFINALKNGTFVLGLDQYSTSARNWVNGVIFGSGDAGSTFTTLANGNFTSLTQDPTTGTLYGHTENVSDNLQSNDGGVTWDSAAWDITPLGFTNTGKGIVTTNSGFKMSAIDTISWQQIKVADATSGFFPKRILFTPDDKMHILAISQLDGTQRLYVSDGAVR